MTWTRHKNGAGATPTCGRRRRGGAQLCLKRPVPMRPGNFSPMGSAFPRVPFEMIPEWLGRWICNRKVSVSIRRRSPFKCGVGQLVKKSTHHTWKVYCLIVGLALALVFSFDGDESICTSSTVDASFPRFAGNELTVRRVNCIPSNATLSRQASRSHIHILLRKQNNLVQT